jgi:hypothetical protein
LLDRLFHSQAFVGQNHLQNGPILLAGKIILATSLEDISKEQASLGVLWKACYQGIGQVPQARDRPGKLAVRPDHFLLGYSS